MAKVVAARAWLVLLAAPAGRAGVERQNVIVECREDCDTVAAALRRMGGEVSPGDAAGRLAVSIDTERLPEIPMIREVRAAFKEPASDSGSAATERSAPAVAQPATTSSSDSIAARLVAPGKAVALLAARPGLIRTAGAADRIDPIQRGADLALATASGKVVQNDLLPVQVNVPAGTRELSFVLLWEAEPSDDVDLIVLAPEGNAEVAGATLQNPERVVVHNPTPGVWTAFVNGFAMNGRADDWQLGVSADGVPLPSH